MTTPHVAFITGAGSRLGEATSLRLGREGRIIVATDINGPEAKRVADEVAAAGGKAIALPLDVTDHEAVAAAVSDVKSEFGRLDILVCSAGIGHPALPVWELEPEDWHRCIDVNLHGIFYACRSAVPLMLEHSYGRIVLIGSIAGKEGNPSNSAYSVSKGAVLAFTKSLGKELATSGILVNAIAPAIIDTPMVSVGDSRDSNLIDYMLSKIPMGRVGKPDEVAALIAWLTSEECSFSTGAVYDISGGRATY